MKIDFRNLTFQAIGEVGITEDDYDALYGALLNAHRSYQANKDSLGFTYLPCDEKVVEEVKQVCEKAGTNMENIVVIGIGGSDLGARAVHAALNHPYYNELAEKTGKDLYFIGDTTDPTEIEELLDILELEETLFIMISKSGNTIEPALSFVIIRERIITELGEGADKKHFLIVTDPKEGMLRKIVDDNNYLSLAIPRDVGGRFSVLSPVGLAPLYFTGIDIDMLLAGARAQAESVSNGEDISINTALTYAGYLFLYHERNFNIHVLMPYAHALQKFGDWFRQLWAESLGKKKSNGEHVGSTPIAALGPTDQHSQLQLYVDGPLDKVVTFITTKEFSNDIMVPNHFKDIEDLAYLGSHSMTDIINKEAQTTAYALTTNNRPNCTIELDKINPASVGKLIYFYELVVTYLGYLFGIDAFSQPGVELSKNAMYGLLGRKGFEKEKQKFEAYLSKESA